MINIALIICGTFDTCRILGTETGHIKRRISNGLYMVTVPTERGIGPRCFIVECGVESRTAEVIIIVMLTDFTFIVGHQGSGDKRVWHNRGMAQVDASDFRASK